MRVAGTCCRPGRPSSIPPPLPLPSGSFGICDDADFSYYLYHAPCPHCAPCLFALWMCFCNWRTEGNKRKNNNKSNMPNVFFIVFFPPEMIIEIGGQAKKCYNGNLCAFLKAFFLALHEFWLEYGENFGWRPEKNNKQFLQNSPSQVSDNIFACY